MNEHAIITVGNSGNDYKDLGTSLWFDDSFQITPTLKNLIDKWNAENPWAPYKKEDFLYNAYYGLIPNNHLITLRRFYRPTYDNMQVQIADPSEDFLKGNKKDIAKNHYPLATAVTWFGNETGNDLGNLLGFTCGLNWSKVEADVHKVDNGSVNFDNGNSLIKNILRGVAIGTGDRGLQSGGSGYVMGIPGFDPYGSDKPYANRVYGPINVIMETYKRDRGLDFAQEFTLNFKYKLRSIDSNNPRVVMMDILSNFLTLCFNFGEFWGGMYRFNPGSWENSPIPGGVGFISQLHTKDIDTILAATKNVFAQMSSGLSTTFNKFRNAASTGGFKGIMNEILGVMQNTGYMNKLISDLGVGDFTSAMSMPPLLSGEPIGEWHMTIGNPFNPTLMVGNLICDNLEVKFNNELSIEGFPTEVEFIISLKHGRPRDAGDIQAMFNRGNSRIYHYRDNTINESSSSRNSKIDNSGELAKKFGFETTQGEIIRKK
jgi:hypothetical protein